MSFEKNEYEAKKNEILQCLCDLYNFNSEIFLKSR